MWDTDVCTNLIEGTPWIKHFAKHSQTGSVHLVMKSLLVPGTVLWLPGARGELWGVGGQWGRPRAGWGQDASKHRDKVRQLLPGRPSSRLSTSWGRLQQTESGRAGME